VLDSHGLKQGSPNYYIEISCNISVNKYKEQGFLEVQGVDGRIIIK
jgi:hypothetical protein